MRVDQISEHRRSGTQTADDEDAWVTRLQQSGRGTASLDHARNLPEKAMQSRRCLRLTLEAYRADMTRVKDIERALRAACALRENGYGEYATTEYIKRRFDLDDREAHEVLASATSLQANRQVNDAISASTD